MAARIAAGGSTGGQGGLAQEDIARLESMRAFEDRMLHAASQGRQLGEGDGSTTVSGVPCTYDSECAAGKCIFDYNAYYLGLCFSRCGLCS